MADTLKVPVFGQQKKTTVYVVGGAVIVFLGVAYLRTRSKSTSDTATIPESEINPATGYAYGSPEDAQSTAAMSAYQNPTDYGGGGGPAQTPAPAAGFTSNAQWTQAAVDYLTNTAEYPAATVSSALGKYINGAEIVKGSTDDTIVMQAIAAEGQPPVAGDGGFPPSIRHVTAPVAATRLGKVTVRFSILKKRVGSTAGTARLAWGAVSHATEYRIHFSPDGTAAASALLGTTPNLYFDVHKPGWYDVYAGAAGSSLYAQSPIGNVVHITGI